MEVSPQRYAQHLEYSMALQRAIEYHCAGHFIPLEISVECPHHSAMLNNRLNEIISEREAAQHHMHADAAGAADKAGESAPEADTIKPAGSQAAPVM